MFNFNTTKKQNEPTLNTAVGGSTNYASQNFGNQNGFAFNNEKEAYINSKVEALEAQRREFMKKKPDFDMKTEMENPDFKRYILGNNLSVEEAYFLVHHDEIVAQAVNEALVRLEARRNRIAENGAGKNSPAVVKKNPKEMSDKEIDSIIARVQNGERITF